MLLANLKMRYTDTDHQFG